MGFSLQSFINELYAQFNTEQSSPGESYAELKRLVKEGAEYAAQCGLIELPK